ncbi:MAG: formylglycine-generating enzyme family protein [Candidatus Magnetoovum sp. WYHC-5]|nr:formylglycine-generating enzyme family protein [Candidatus Magnetoovum sp. WYHC-5]
MNRRRASLPGRFSVMRRLIFASLVAAYFFTSCMSSVQTVPERLVENIKDNEIGLYFVLVKGGCFDMGCGDWAISCEENEKPLHKVCIDDFYMSKYEVTQGQWKKIMGENPAYFQGSANHPVETVTFSEVTKFIALLNEKTNNKYTLPSEAQWEYACREGGKDNVWSGVKSENLLGEVAWYVKNSGYETQPVGTKNPNSLGLYDMSGNVSEFVLDDYVYDAYASYGQQNPIVKQSASADRVIRGGSLEGFSKQLRCLARFDVANDYKDNFFGFRLVSPAK